VLHARPKEGLAGGVGGGGGENKMAALIALSLTTCWGTRIPALITRGSRPPAGSAFIFSPSLLCMLLAQHFDLFGEKASDFGGGGGVGGGGEVAI
jgi:hypothetical protein